MEIPNAFIQTHIKYEKDMSIIKSRGVLVYIMLEIALDVYETYVIMDRKGANQLIFQCQKSIYGTMTAIMIYYKKFRRSIEDEGYEFNPYDPCVTNKIIKLSQKTVCFHVDY